MNIVKDITDEEFNELIRDYCHFKNNQRSSDANGKFIRFTDQDIKELIYLLNNDSASWYIEGDTFNCFYRPLEKEVVDFETDIQKGLKFIKDGLSSYDLPKAKKIILPKDLVIALWTQKNDVCEELIIPSYDTTQISGAFTYFTNLKKLYLGDNVKNLPSSCFGRFTNNSSSFKEVEFSDNCKLETIPKECFRNQSIEKVKLSSSINKIDTSAFSECTYLTTINLKDVEVIGDEAFNYCESLKEIDLTNIESLGLNAFAQCADLKSVTFGSNIKEIPIKCFKECISLEKVTIPGNINTIGKEAFYSCDSLSEVILEEGVASIESNAFKFCQELTTIHLPKSLRNIGYNAFNNCASLKTIFYNGTEEELYEIDSYFKRFIQANNIKVICKN